MGKDRPPIEQDSHLPPEIVEKTQDIELAAKAAGAVVTAHDKRVWAAQELRTEHRDEVEAAIASASTAGAPIDSHTKGKLAGAVSHQILTRGEGVKGSGGGRSGGF